MGKSNTQQTSYASGEVSPLLRARNDIARYTAGCETCENFIVRPQGALWRRNGTAYIGQTLENQASVLVEFVFSSAEAYLLEFGTDGVLRFVVIRDNTGAPVFADTAKSIVSAAVSGGGTEFTTSAAHGFAANSIVEITGATEPSYNGLWVVDSVGATTFVVSAIPFVATATGSARKVVAVQAIWGVSTIPELSFAQSADTLFIVHPLVKPKKLTRTSATSWTLSDFETVDGPYLDYDKNDTRLTVSGIVDTGTMKANAAMVAGNPFAVGDVGKWIEFFDDGEWYLGKITVFVSTSEVDADIIQNVKVGIHPATALSSKTSDNAKPSSRSLLNTSQGNNSAAARTYTHPFYRPKRTVPGVSPNTAPSAGVVDGVDQNAKLTLAGTTFTSTHRNTFDRSDVGKYVRIVDGTGGGAADSWRKIVTFTNDFTVEVGAALAGGFKTYAYASGEEATLEQGSRAIVANLKSTASLFTGQTGRHVRMNFQGRWVYAKITAVTNAFDCSIQLFDSFPRHLRNAEKLANDGKTDIFRMGAWYDANYPSFVTFHEQRLWFANTPGQPQTLWGSRPQDFDKMSPSEPDGSVLDDNAIDVTLASNKVNAITWLKSMRVLMVGTFGGEWQGRAASSITEPMAPTNIVFTEETTHGAIDDSIPVKVGSAVLFLQRSGQKLLEMTYNWELDGWTSRDLTIASEHIFRKGTKGIKMAYQNEPHGIVWALTSSGELAALTYKREQEVLGWHYHRIGGSGVVGSIATIPSSNGTEDTLFMVVKRTINGVTRRYIERLASDHYPASASDKNGFFYVDAGVTETMGGSGSTWTAFRHLVGASVQVLKNGVLQGTFTVNSSGAVTGLSYVNGDVLTGGLAYTSKFKSLPVQGGSPYGSSDMTMKRVARLFLRVYNSIGAKIGRSESALVPHTFDPTGLLFTGDYGRETNLDYSSDGVFHIQVSDPYPLILLSHVAQVVSNE